jgi:uncharacterized membrane protein
MESNTTYTVHASAGQDQKVKTIVITAFFAAITYLGIQVFRIPLPAAIGTPFVHFGHIFVVMGVLLQGGKRGAVSGTLGLITFDVLNGYIQEIPLIFAETVVKALIVGAVFYVLKKRADGDRAKEYKAAIIAAFVYGVVHILIEFGADVVKMMLLGSNFSAAVAGAVVSIPAVLINTVFMFVAVVILYKPISSIYQRIVNA